MKQLFRAKEIHEEIINLDKDIIVLERNLDSLMLKESNGTIKLCFDSDIKKEPILDEDVRLTGNYMYKELTFYLNQRINKEEKSKYKDEFKADLSYNEIIIVMASLLNHKKDRRKNLINEFNELSLKLKIR